MERKIIGECAVDSGQLILVDPSYLAGWREEDHYQDVVDATGGSDRGGEVLVKGVAGYGVAVETGLGDGSYPVEAIYEDGRVRAVRVRFF